MNRKLLSGLTLASVAGTGGVAYATVARPANAAPAAVFAGPIVTTGATSTTAAPTTSEATTSAAAADGRTISYQVGDAGTVNIDVAGSVMTSRGLVPASGWTIGAMSNSGTHLDVQFANTERLVGFSADLVGANVVVSVTNDRRPGTPGPIAPVDVSVIGGADTSTVPSPATAPSFDTVIPATPAPAKVTTRPPVAPPAASTTAPSSAGNSGNDDGGHEGKDGSNSGHDGEHDGNDDD